MILYYTASQKTKIFAETLRDLLELPLYELKSPLKDKKFFFLRAIYLAITGKGYPVSNMPAQIAGDEIYLCAPVWAGTMAAPAWFFLNNAELKNKKVNLVLTCSEADDNYRKKALDALRLIDCVPGEAYVFATGGGTPEPDVLKEHIRGMIAAHR